MIVVLILNNNIALLSSKKKKYTLLFDCAKKFCYNKIDISQFYYKYEYIGAVIVLIKAEKRDYLSIWHLYRSAFPRSERKPFFVIRRKVKEGSMTVYKIVQNGFAGLMITVEKGDLLLLNYFAIKPNKRGGGIGTNALKELLQKNKGHRIFLEIEEVTEGASNYNERVHRKGFYLRNGLSESGVFSELFGVKMEVLISGGSITPEEYESFYETLFGDRVMKHIKAYKGG